MTLPAPVLLRDTLRGGQSFAWEEEAGTFRGVAGGRPAVIVPRGRGAQLQARPADHRWFAEYLRLSDPYSRHLAKLSRDPALAPAVARHRGLRLLRQDPWEALAAFIVSANNHVPRIEGILRRLARAAGAAVAGWEGAVAFPAPHRVAALGPARLLELGCGYRAPYLAEAARLAGGMDLAALRRASREEARAALLEFPGVGPKVADCVLLFALDHTDAFPVDRHVARACARRWPDAPQHPEDLADWARRRWGRQAGLAQQFLFHDERLVGSPAA